MMLLGQVIYRRKADDAVMLYAGEVDGWDMARIVTEGREFEPNTLFALLARGGWEPTSAVPVEQDDEVVKHFQGTEHDHDQSTHGRRATGRMLNPVAVPVAVRGAIGDEGSGSENKARVQKVIGKHIADSDLSTEEIADALQRMVTGNREGSGDDRVLVYRRSEIEMLGRDWGRLYFEVVTPRQSQAIDRSGWNPWWVEADGTLKEGAFFIDEALTDEQRLDVSELVANTIVDAWSASSNRSIISLAAQMVAQEEFGLEQAVDPRSPSNLSLGAAENLKAAAGPVIATALRGMYEETQKTLREAFPDQDSMVLYRGGDSPQRYGVNTWTVRDTARQAWDDYQRKGMTDRLYVEENLTAGDWGVFSARADIPPLGSDVGGVAEYGRARSEIARRGLQEIGVDSSSMTSAQLDAAYEVFDDVVRLYAAWDAPQSMTQIRGLRDAAQGFASDESVSERISRVFALERPPMGASRETLQGRPLMSFSTDLSTAIEFGGGGGDVNQVFASVVPFERIMSTVVSGYGSTDETEFVVLGGPMSGMVTWWADTGAGIDHIMSSTINGGLAEISGEFITVDGKPIPLAKHLLGTKDDHDQSRHAGSRSIAATGGRADIVKVTDTTYRYDYGDFNITTNITGRQLLEDTYLDGTYYSTDNPPSAIEDLGEVAMDSQWNQWRGNFVMRHLSAAMMGLPHQYASGGETLREEIQDAIIYGERPDNPVWAESAEGLLRDHAATTHAMLQAIADERLEFAEPWDGIVRRGMTVAVDEFGESPLTRLREGDTMDLALSAFTPSVDLLDRFLRGGDQSREVMQRDDDFVFTPKWRSVMFELDTRTSRYIAPAGWGGLTSDSEMWVYTSYEDRAADEDDGEDFRKQPVPWEIVTAGKFRVTGTRDEPRTFIQPYGTQEEFSEDVKVIAIQQTAVYNPRTNTYDALPGFVTLPDGRVIPVEEAA